jgi:hypothetical protein
MIITECQECGAPIFDGYEAGDEPIGALARVECRTCGANNYITRISVGGITYSEAEFQQMLAEGKVAPLKQEGA